MSYITRYLQPSVITQPDVRRDTKNEQRVSDLAALFYRYQWVINMKRTDAVWSRLRPVSGEDDESDQGCDSDGDAATIGVCRGWVCGHRQAQRPRV